MAEVYYQLPINPEENLQVWLHEDYKWLEIDVVDWTDVKVTKMQRVLKSGAYSLLLSGGYIDPQDQAVNLMIYNPLSYYLGLKVYEDTQSGSYGHDMMNPVPGSETYADLNREEMIVVYPSVFTNFSYDAPYFFALAKDPGYGQVNFDLWEYVQYDKDLMLKGYDPPQWANLGRRCRSGRTPDCDSGIWSGAVGGLGVGGMGSLPGYIPGVGIVVAAGELYTWGPQYLTEGISIVCGRTYFGPTSYIGFSASGMYCWSKSCIEELNGTGVSLSYSYKGFQLSASGGCFAMGVSAMLTEGGGKTYALQGCRLETLSGP